MRIFILFTLSASPTRGEAGILFVLFYVLFFPLRTILNKSLLDFHFKEEKTEVLRCLLFSSWWSGSTPDQVDLKFWGWDPASLFFHLKIFNCSLAGVAQWIEHQTANWKAASSIPGQGTCLGCGPGPSGGCMGGNCMLMFLSLFLPLSLPLKMNK